MRPSGLRWKREQLLLRLSGVDESCVWRHADLIPEEHGDDFGLGLRLQERREEVIAPVVLILNLEPNVVAQERT